MDNETLFKKMLNEEIKALVEAPHFPNNSFTVDIVINVKCRNDNFGGGAVMFLQKV